MVRCITAFMDACYIARWNAITSPALEHFRESVERFHKLRNIFIATGVRASISLPRQHALSHFHYAMQFFGSPNGICSSITESKHIKAVKEPWRRSSRFKALIQMLRIILRMEKLAALRQIFAERGMLYGTTSLYMAGIRAPAGTPDMIAEEDNEDDDGGPVPGDPTNGTLSVVNLANKPRMYNIIGHHMSYANRHTEHNYPRDLTSLASYINQPQLPIALQQFLYTYQHPELEVPSTINDYPPFDGEIRVYHSATATFYAPSDLCGAGGMRREQIRSTPCFHGHPRRDTVFVVLDDSQPGMKGMEIARVLLFFSFHYRRKSFSCALINWFVHSDEPDADTGMWTVELECEARGTPTVQVIEVEMIARGAHLLPVYGTSRVPDQFSHHNALDSFQSFFVNCFVDHHAHEFI